MVDRPRNQCSWKRKCMMCKDVDMEDRPMLCDSLSCEFYIPCSRCGVNADGIDPEIGHCDNLNCKHANTIMPSTDITVGETTITSFDSTPKRSSVEPAVVSSGKKRRKISRPGQPPDELAEEERIYYEERWSEYEGYYRDPVAYVTCHYLILEEIKLSYIMSEILGFRGELLLDKEKEKSRIYDNIHKLKGQLPDKESERLSDDQIAIGMIHDLYCKELGKTKRAGMLRVLSPEAVALAPRLPFKIDAERLLRNCGYSLIEAQDAAQRIYDGETIDRSGLDTLEWLGFKVNEKYAMPFSDDMDDINEDTFEDTDGGLVAHG